MPLIISLCSAKGGVGKTTAAIGLATAAHIEGNKVLLLDLDPTAAASKLARIASKAGNNFPEVRLATPNWLANEGAEILKEYELVIIDCPPYLGDATQTALLFSHIALLPCMPSIIDFITLGEVIDLVSSVKQERPKMLVRLLFSRWKKTLDARSVEKGVAQRFPDVLPLDSALHERVTHQRALAQGLSVAEYEPNGDAAKELRALLRELHSIVKGVS